MGKFRRYPLETRMMAAAAAASLQVPKPGEISEVAKIQKVERCLLTLPFVDALSDETIDSVAKKATVKDFARTTTFITAGSEAQGIYILVEGRVEILANDETVMAEIDVNDFVGEVSVLYGTPATASVRAESQTVMLFIDKNTVKSIGKLKREMHINQWFITRKYLPTSKLVDKQLITEGVLSDALKNVPLFRDWCQASMIELIKCTDGIVVYPPHSFITYTGDPGHEVILLIKGKMEADEIWFIPAKKYPFVLSEEGLFTQRDHPLTVRAKTCCQILRLKKDDIVFIKSRFSSSARTAWDSASANWKKYMASRNHDIFKKHNKYLQQELVFKMLRESSVFHNCPVGFAYFLSMNCTFHDYEAKAVCLTEKEYVANVSFLIVEGKVALMEQQRTMDVENAGVNLQLKANARNVFEMEDRDFFYRSNWMPQTAHCVATVDDTVLVKVTREMIDEGVKRFPATNVIEIQLQYMSDLAKELRKNLKFKPKGKASLLKPKTPVA